MTRPPARRRTSGPPAERAAADQADRDLATGDLDRSHVVEAGAGTGKTTILIDRIVNLLLLKPVTLDQIVAITFTEKAAGELKVRLRKRLEEECTLLAASSTPLLVAGELSALSSAINDLERAPIETIHAFAARLLHDRPVEARVDPRFETLDPLRRELLFDELWEPWLETALAARPEALRRAWIAGVGPESWRRLAHALLEARIAARRPLPPQGPEPDARAFLDAALARLEGVHERLAAACRDDEDNLLREVGETLAELRTWSVREPGAVGAGGAGEAAAAASYLLRDLELPDARGNKARYRPESALEEAREALAALRDDLAAYRSTTGDHLVRSVLVALDGFADRFAEVKRERGLLDFDDLLLRARDLLVDQEETRRELALRYRHLLVDEFQDTDPLQAEIVFLLCDEEGTAGSWDQVNVPPGKLFLVGDPKQSIYRFRRADIELYERAKKALLGERPPLAITENFRSDAGLLEWVNTVFTGTMSRPDDGGLYQPDYRALTPHHTDLRSPQAVSVLLPAAALDERMKVDEQRRLEAAAIAGLVQQLIGDKVMVRARQGKVEGRREIRASDVAVLTRAMTDIEIYEEAFRAAEVPYRLDGGKDYYQRAEVQALLRLLEAIDDPEDEIATVTALRSPIFGVSDVELSRHRLAGLRFDGREGSPEPAIAEAFTCLRELRALRDLLDPPALVLAALERTHFAALVALKPHGQQRTANLLKLADTAAALVEAGLTSFRDVVRYLGELEQRDDVEESESPLSEEGDGAVRITTIHKAKGLEFPVVVLADLGRDSGGRGKPLVLVDRESGRIEASVRPRDSKLEAYATDGYAALLAGDELRERAESLRVLYVAVTRARDRLVLPVFSPDAALATRDVARSPAFRALAGRVPGIGQDEARSGAERVHRIDAGSLPEAPAPAILRRPFGPPFDGGEVARARERARGEWEASRALALGRAGRGVPFLHPSKVTAHGGSVGAASDEPRRTPPGAGVGVRVGVAVHRALERADLRDRAGALLVAQTAARALALDAQASARVSALVAAALASGVVGDALRSGTVVREVPFAVRIAGVLVEGSADLLIDDARGLRVVDWKTDAVASPAAVEALALRYRPQGLLYALALEHAVGRPVRDVVLVFLGAPGGALEVVIPFDDAARAEAQLLLRAVAGE